MAAKKKAPDLPDLPPIEELPPIDPEVVEGEDKEEDSEPHDPPSETEEDSELENEEGLESEIEKEPEPETERETEYEPTELDMLRIRLGTVPQLEDVLSTDGLPAKLRDLVAAELERRAKAEEKSKPKRGQRIKTTTRALRATRDGFLTEVPAGTMFDLSEADTLEAEGIQFVVVTVELVHDQMGLPMLVEVA